MKYLKKFKLLTEDFRVACKPQLDHLGIDEEDLQNLLQDLIDDSNNYNNIVCTPYFGTPDKPETIVKFKETPRNDLFVIHVYHLKKGLQSYKDFEDEYFDQIDSRLQDRGLKILSIKKHIDNLGGGDSFHLLIGRRQT